MDFLKNLFIPPSTDHLVLVKYIILLIYFVYIPFISVFFGGTFFSILFRLLSGKNKNSLYWRVSKDFIETLVFRKTAGVLLGILPLFILTMIEGQVFYDANISIVSYMSITTLLIAIGVTLVYFYQSTYSYTDIHPGIQILLGVLGLFFLLNGFFVFSMSTALVLDPGRWAVVNSPGKFLFSWNVIAKFSHFIFTALAVTGAAILFFFFNWKDSLKDMDEHYAEYMKKIGGGIALSLMLLQPILIFWNLVTIPDQGLSEGVYILTIIVLFLILFICLLLYILLKESRLEFGSNIFVLLIIILVIMIVNDHLARENSIKNHSNLLLVRAKEVEAAIDAEREALLASSIQPDPVLGETVYSTQCNACHRFDQKLVGPPYNEVLPKYLNDPEGLTNFIRKPVKVNPDYPPMPQLGLSEKEIKSVTVYLLDRVKENE
jgi:cytochrome c